MSIIDYPKKQPGMSSANKLTVAIPTVTGSLNGIQETEEAQAQNPEELQT